MKKIFLICFFVSLFSSCEQDESLDPRPLIVPGQYVTLNIDYYNKYIDATNLSTSSFRGTLSNPGGNVVKYELFMRRKNSIGDVSNGDFALYKTINSFPYVLEIKAQDIADFYDINFSEISQGQSYEFLAYSYDANGIKTGYTNLSGIVKTTASMKQGYRFKTGIELPNEDTYANYKNYSF
ncbi:MAG: hypothetical protein O9267_10875 [Flavobacterium sp.]|uniref:hypothetical protein n=1 Tax=Flavobacterium sp. TaxID=239 RepID=UPI0022C92449|nr:hypothetical protein [Flavobacterium sp.]MCZ8198101.1 hypothetical protein [Flavobacterium sp.]